MIQVNGHDFSKFYYDQKYDDLTIKINSAPKVYSDEVIDDVYLVRNEINDMIVAVQILYFKEQREQTLLKFLPEDIFKLVMEFKKQLND